MFTHWGISGPVTLNATLSLGQEINRLKDYRLQIADLKLKLIFDLEKTNKKIINYLKLDQKNNFVELDIKDLRPWEEAKVTG